MSRYLNRRLFIIFAIAIVVGVGGWALGKDQAPRFPHGAHLVAGAKCPMCHNKAAESALSTDWIRPKKQRCEQCHGSEVPQISWHDPAIYPIYFSHVAHLARGAVCLTCHGLLDDNDMGTPSHPECYKCHNDKIAPHTCSTCHLNTQAVKPAFHNGDWLMAHAALSTSDKIKCEGCHTAASCDACHARRDIVHTERHHPADFFATHSDAARTDRLTCTSCHDERRFCGDCHMLRYRTMTNPESGQPLIRPQSHIPLSWRFGDHGKTAQLDMEYCQSCHGAYGQSPICLTCHADTQLGGNGYSPHGPNFGSNLGFGDWHNDPNAICFQCHSSQGTFCTSCHDEGGGDGGGDNQIKSQRKNR